MCRYVLLQLHPQLSFPTLQAATHPADTDGTQQQPRPPWSEAHRQYAHHRKAALRPVGSSAQTAATPLLPAKRKAESEALPPDDGGSADVAVAGCHVAGGQRCSTSGVAGSPNDNVAEGRTNRRQPLRAVLAAATQLIQGLLSDNSDVRDSVAECDTNGLRQLIAAVKTLRSFCLPWWQKSNSSTICQYPSSSFVCGLWTYLAEHP